MKLITRFNEWRQYVVYDLEQQCESGFEHWRDHISSKFYPATRWERVCFWYEMKVLDVKIWLCAKVLRKNMYDI